MRYYDLQRYWTKRIEPHLANRKLNAVLVRNFNLFTQGKWGKPFALGQLPRDFESCDWDWEHCGPAPRFWRYVKHGACHWLVNSNLCLAHLVEPDRPWRIVTSDEHSTVWDGKDMLFEFNFLAFGISPHKCFEMADEKRLAPGKELKVYLANGWRDVA